MAAFTAAGTLSTDAAPVLRSKILKNSQAFTVFDSVKVASGFVAPGTAGALVEGHISSISTNQGVGLNTDGSAGAQMGSYLGTYTTASDNQTVAMVRGAIDVSKKTLYSATADATLGTTTGSNLDGYYMDLVSATQLDESSAVTTTAQYRSEGLDPLNSSRVIVHIYESAVFGV